VGPNAHGKTTILEALSLATNLRSFKTSSSSELIRKGETQSLVSVQLEKPTASKITVGLEGNRKSVRVDEKAIASRARYPFLGGSLSFSPDDLMLIKGSPENRRDFLDSFSISLNPQYDSVLQKYSKVLKQRNALLKSIKEGKAFFEELPLWTESLIEAAIPIYQERYRAVALLNQNLPDVYRQLFHTTEKIRFQYGHRFASDISEERSQIENQLIEKLNQVAVGETATGYTLVGPHKDDLEIFIDDLDCRTYGSQAQTRGLVIALKVTQLELSRHHRSWSPLLLLDDIISEFDDHRVHSLVDYLSQYPGQLFVTTAEINKVKALHSQFSAFKVIDLSPKSHQDLRFVLEEQA